MFDNSQHSIIVKVIAILIVVSLSIIDVKYGFLAVCALLLYVNYQLSKQEGFDMSAFLPNHAKTNSSIDNNTDTSIFKTDQVKMDYLDGIDIIYWINLDRSYERKTHMDNLFQDDVFKNIPTERISAIDGKLPKKVYSKLNLKYKQKNDYEYACLLSHLETVRKFSETDYNVAMIMEDDITLEFKKYWRKSVKQILANAPSDWEIIQLCYITVNNDPRKFKEYEINTQNKCVSAAAYLIKNRVAKKLIRGIYNSSDGKYSIEPNVNHHADCYLFYKCKTYTYKYPYFIYKTNNTSLLHPEDLVEHEQSKQKIINMYKSLSK